MEGPRTIFAAFRVVRRRRLRPERYRSAAGGLVALFSIIAVVRYGTNLYLNVLLGHVPPTGGLSLFNAAWAMTFFSTVVPLVAYRGVATLLQNRRLDRLPVPHRRRVAALLASAVVNARAAGAGVALVAAMVVAGTLAAGLPPAGLCLATIVAGLAGWTMTAFLLYRVELPPRTIETFEIALYAAIVLANPDFRVVRDQLVLSLFQRSFPLGRPGYLISLMPLYGSAFVSFVAAATVLVDRFQRVMRMRARARRLRRHEPAAAGIRTRSVGASGVVRRLYAVELPVVLAVGMLALELAIVFRNPALRTTVRNTVVLFAALQTVWFIGFVFRTEQLAAVVFRAPATPANRVRVFRSAGLVHLALVAAPILVYLVRLAAERSGP